MKYIVYKTTNLINNYIYIGVHKTKNPNQFDLYLGCGVRANKPSTYEQGKTCFQNAVKIFGVKNFYRETLAIFDSAEDAYELESILVNDEFLARPDVYNMLKGGTLNYSFGRPVYLYDLVSGVFITSYLSCAAAAEVLKCSAQTVSRGIKYYYSVLNTILSYIKAESIDVTPFLNSKAPKRVYRYLKTGEFDKSYLSLSSAGIDTFDCTPAYIDKAAKLGYLVKDCYYFSFYKESSYDKARTVYIQNRPVFCYSNEGVYMKSYETLHLAELEHQNCNIAKSIRLKIPDKNGNYWALVKVPIFNRPERRAPKKVGKYDEDGNLLQTWDSFNKCAKEVGPAVQNVLQNKYTHHKGFIYKYID